jgi:hypothetical protein
MGEQSTGKLCFVNLENEEVELAQVEDIQVKFKHEESVKPFKTNIKGSGTIKNMQIDRSWLLQLQIRQERLKKYIIDFITSWRKANKGA